MKSVILWGNCLQLSKVLVQIYTIRNLSGCKAPLFFFFFLFLKLMGFTGIIRNYPYKFLRKIFLVIVAFILTCNRIRRIFGRCLQILCGTDLLCAGFYSCRLYGDHVRERCKVLDYNKDIGSQDKK